MKRNHYATRRLKRLYFFAVTMALDRGAQTDVEPAHRILLQPRELVRVDGQRSLRRRVPQDRRNSPNVDASGEQVRRGPMARIVEPLRDAGLLRDHPEGFGESERAMRSAEGVREHEAPRLVRLLGLERILGLAETLQT